MLTVNARFMLIFNAGQQLTGRRGSHTLTRNNIVEAVRRGVRLRVGIVDIGDEVDSACEDLRSLGIEDIRIGPGCVR